MGQVIYIFFLNESYLIINSNDIVNRTYFRSTEAWAGQSIFGSGEQNLENWKPVRRLTGHQSGSYFILLLISNIELIKIFIY